MRDFRKRLQKRYEGLSFVELSISLTLFLMLAGSISFLAVDSIRTSKNSQRRIIATQESQVLLEAVRSYKTDNFVELRTHSGGTQKHFTTSGGTYSIGNGTKTEGNITSHFTVEDVYRDENGDVVTTGGELDRYALELTTVVVWTDVLGTDHTITNTTYVNNWNVQRWRHDTVADFAPGTFYQTRTVENGNGAVELDVYVDLFPNWCNPALSTSYYDISGSGEARTIFGVFGEAYLGTGGNASGTAYTKLDIDGVQTPTITVAGTWDSGKINWIATEGDYSYTTSDDNSKELRILDHTADPIVEVGSGNGPSSTDADNAFVPAGNTWGYLAQGRQFTVFDNSSAIGTRTMHDSINLGTSTALINKIHTNGDYAYVSLTGDTNELTIVDVSDEDNVSVVSSLSLNDADAVDIYNSVDSNRTYIATKPSATGDELFIIDTTTKSSPSIVGSINVPDSSLNALAIVEIDNVAIVVGDAPAGTEDYQVFDLTTETEIDACGGLELTDEFYDIDAVQDEDENVFTYSVTANTSKEFQIVRGGPGEIGGNGFGYYDYGTYESVVLDTDSTETTYYGFSWDEELEDETDFEVQMRAGDTSDLSGETWVGPDGTNATVFTDPTYNDIPAALQDKRYFQFIGYFYSDNVNFTSRLLEIDFYFEE